MDNGLIHFVTVGKSGISTSHMIAARDWPSTVTYYRSRGHIIAREESEDTALKTARYESSAIDGWDGFVKLAVKEAERARIASAVNAPQPEAPSPVNHRWQEFEQLQEEIRQHEERQRQMKGRK